jgi:hypothetical protein
MHPSIRHYAIRVDRDDVVVDLPAHRSYRSVQLEQRRAHGERRSLRDRIWSAGLGRRSAPTPA